MNVLHVNNQVRLGGAETVVRQLLRGFPGASLAVADGKTFPPDVHPLYPRPLARLYHTRLKALVERAAPRDRWTDRAFRQLASGPHDLIHLHNFHGRYATIESLAHLARRKPVVWTFHALWGVTGGCDHPRDCHRYLSACGQCPQLGRWPLGTVDHTEALLAAKLALLADLPLHIVAPSAWLATVVRGSRVGRRWSVSQIPNAVDGEFTRALSSRPPARGAPPASVLIVNRNFRDEQKGFQIAKAALTEVARSTNHRPRLLLAGENSDWATGQLASWECESFGYVSEPAALAELQLRADIFLFASPAENFPCVVLEAMAASGCIVAAPAGGIVEQVEDGVSGLLASEISGLALAEVLARALSDPPLRVRLGEAACWRAQREFTENIFIERYRKLYEDVLCSWRPSA